jgi:hypothetical protein
MFSYQLSNIGKYGGKLTFSAAADGAAIGRKK